MNLADRDKDILEMYDNGLSYKIISEVFGLTRARVCQIVNGHGCSGKRRGKRGPCDGKEHEILQLRKAGKTMREIAEVYGVTHQAIALIIKKNS